MATHQVKRGGDASPTPAPVAPGVIEDHHDPIHHREFHAPDHDDRPKHPPDPRAMAAYIDHDHAPMDAKTAAALAQITAINAKLLADTNAIVEQEKARKAAEEQQKKIKESINSVTAVVTATQLAMLSRDMSDSNSKAFIQTLDRIDNPDLRHKVMAQFAAQTGQSLESFISSNKDWNNTGSDRDQKAALQLVSKDRDKAEDAIAAMPPEVKAQKEKDAEDAAIQIIGACDAHDHGDENMQKIFRAMGHKSPAEIEMIRAAVAKHTHGESNLYQKIDDGTHKGDEDEAVAMLAGDPVASARAALANETDPKRLREVVGQLDDGERKDLASNPMFANMAIARLDNPADRAELSAAINKSKADADAEHLANLLKPKDEGMQPGFDKVGLDNYDRRKPANVLKEFEAMSGEDVKAARDAWNAAHPERPFEQMLKDRWGDDSDPTEYNRLMAMMEGDKGKNRAIRVQEGMREKDQDEIEGALAHAKTDEKALQSKDDKTRKAAEAVRDENASFERNNVELDRQDLQRFNDTWGIKGAPVVGRSTKAQLTGYYDMRAKDDIGSSAGEVILGGDAADRIHKDRQDKHDDKVLDNKWGAMDLLDDGKLSASTEMHRGKGAKEKAEAAESITSNKELAEQQQKYRERFGKEMFPETKDSRSDMNANELMIDNVREYGVKAERPAQLEYLLQLQQYEKQYSKSLEMDEATDAGGGTQRWQRQELASERDMLKDPKLQAFDHQLVTDANGVPLVIPGLLDNPNEPTVDQIEKLLPPGHIAKPGEKVDDGLKDGVAKSDFTAIDKGMTAANKAEETAKKRLADRIVKIFSTIAKIAAVLTAQPELIALIDIGEGLLEMGIKAQVMGEAYDASEDAKMLAFTAVADVALMGLSKVGSVKGAAKLAEQEAVGVGEKTAMEMEHAVSGEAKAEALSEGAHVAAGESKAMEGAIEEGTSAEKALSSEAVGEVGTKVEQKAIEVGEGKALQEGESAAAKTVASEVESGTIKEAGAAAKEAASPAELAKQIEARWGLYGGAAKMAIQTVGGGIVQGKSPTDILKGLVTGGLGLVLPGHLAEKVKNFVGNDTMALKILGEIASFGTEVTTATTINVAGGAEVGDALLDSTMGAGGGRVQRFYPGHGGGAKHDEEHGSTTREEPTASPAREEAPVAIGPETRAGAGSATGQVSSEGKQARTVENVPAVSERAARAREGMDEATRAQHDEIVAKAESPGQRAVLERALAAGRSPSELDQLRAAMSGLDGGDLVKQFTGSGLIQFFGHSCVPTAYQIAIANVDPMYAFHLRNHPEEMIRAQADALVAGGGSVGKRSDVNSDAQSRFDRMSGNAKEQFSAPGIEEAARSEYQGASVGIEPTVMPAHQLHAQLEQATGAKYEVITHGDADFTTPGAGEFTNPSTPHARIGQAIDDGKPVLFSMNGHEQTIVGRTVEGGKTTYHVADPMTGTTAPWDAALFDMIGATSITLPAVEQAAPRAEVEVSPTPIDSPTRAGGKKPRPPNKDDFNAPQVAPGITPDRVPEGSDFRTVANEELAAHVEATRQARELVPLSNNARKPMLAGVKDLQTGEMITAGNRSEPPEQLHPVMQERLDAHTAIFDHFSALPADEQRRIGAMSADDRQAYLTERLALPAEAGGVKTTEMLAAVEERLVWKKELEDDAAAAGKPMSEESKAAALESARNEIGTHGEFNALNEALMRRQALPGQAALAPEDLKSFLVHNLRHDENKPMSRCENCAQLTAGAEVTPPVAAVEREVADKKAAKVAMKKKRDDDLDPIATLEDVDVETEDDE